MHYKASCGEEFELLNETNQIRNVLLLLLQDNQKTDRKPLTMEGGKSGVLETVQSLDF